MSLHTGALTLVPESLDFVLDSARLAPLEYVDVPDAFESIELLPLCCSVLPEDGVAGGANEGCLDGNGGGDGFD